MGTTEPNREQKKVKESRSNDVISEEKTMLRSTSSKKNKRNMRE